MPLISFVGHPFLFVCSFCSCAVFVHVQSFSLVHGRLCSCVVVLIHARSSSSFEWSWGLLCPWALIVHGWAHCCPWVEGHPWGVIIIQGQVSPSMGGASSSAGGALPSVGGACCCLWMVGLVTWCGLSIKVDIAWVVGIHESGGHGVGVRVGVGGSCGCGHSHRSGWWELVVHWWHIVVVCGRGIAVVGGVIVHGVVSVVPLLYGQGFMVLLRKPSSLSSLIIPRLLGIHR